ncbi:MAG TPA: BMP family ABC transporter substrate-binding protein [Candidatus Scatomorpha stercoravium]|nr:BMP family ABC transporter substrate-binding protein [Candidatus Scatomorpha stercoravium]
MKKFLALLLALVMVFALAACGGEGETTTTEPPADDTTAPVDDTTAPEEPDALDPNDIEDNIEAESYEIAFVTDVGALHDKSFNEGTWNGVKLYAAQNDKTYKYYQPANDADATDEDRFEAMSQAVANGAKVVVCAGYLQEAAIRRAAIEFPDVHFVFIDGYSLTEDPDNPDAAVLTNVAGVNFNEEQCGYLAGYAVVKEGFTQLGFSGGGGGTNAACCRYGYGYLQGASAAAEEMGVDVTVNYSWQYGGAFQASPELQSMIAGWYTNGTEIVFACGGSMFSSITSAASANDGWVIGVDVDQSSQSDTVVTSAMKGIDQAAILCLGHHYDGTWEEVGGKTTTLGAAQDAVGLPTDTWSLENFSVEEYETLFASIKDGSLVIDAEYPVDDSGMDNADSLNGELPNITINVI